MFDYRYPLLEVVQAIEQLRETRGTTNVKVCDFVRKRGKNPNDPMKVLKTVRTLNKLVEDGVLVKRGRRYLFAPKAGEANKEEEEEEEEEQEEDQDEDVSGPAVEMEVLKEGEDFMECDDENMEEVEEVEDDGEEEKDDEEDEEEEAEEEQEEEEEEEDDDDDDDDDDDCDDCNDSTDIVLIDKMENFPVIEEARPKSVATQNRNNSSKNQDDDSKETVHNKKMKTNGTKPGYKSGTSKNNGSDGSRGKCVKSGKKGSKKRCIVMTKKKKNNNNSNSGKKKEEVEQMEMVYSSRRRNSKSRRDYSDPQNHRSRSPIRGNRAALHQVDEIGSDIFRSPMFKNSAGGDVDMEKGDGKGSGTFELYPHSSPVGPTVSNPSGGDLVERKDSFDSDHDPNVTTIKQEVESIEEEGAEELVDVDSRQSLQGAGKESSEVVGRVRERGKERGGRSAEKLARDEEFKALRPVCEKKKRNS